MIPFALTSPEPAPDRRPYEYATFLDAGPRSDWRRCSEAQARALIEAYARSVPEAWAGLAEGRTVALNVKAPPFYVVRRCRNAVELEDDRRQRPLF